MQLLNYLTYETLCQTLYVSPHHY